MTAQTARVFRLRRYAQGVPDTDVFELSEEPTPPLGEGEVLLETLYLGLDPFPRLQIAGPGGRAPQIPLGAVMVGRGVGRVVASRSSSLPVGAVAVGEIGWRDHAVIAADALKRVDAALGPVRYSLSVLGPAGLAAWCSLVNLGAPRAGETVLISAAAGAVGSIAAQLALRRGCKVVGVGGGERQTAFLRNDLGVAAVDYRADQPLADQIRAAAPNGVDVFLDLVAGPVFDAGLQTLAIGARVVLVGTIADYNESPGAPDLAPRINLPVIMKRARLMGFLVADHVDSYPSALAELSEALKDGSVRAAERIVDGFEHTPSAFQGLFGAEFIGKQMVRVKTEPAGVT